jgi:hypothetical protein
LLPAPTAPSEGSAGIRNLVDRTFRPTDPLSILAHQLRRRFLSDRSLLRGARPTYQTTWPEGSLVFRSVRPAIGPKPSVKTVRCSAALLGMTPLASRFAHLPLPLRRAWRSGAASRLRKTSLPAPLPGWPRKEPKPFPIACRRRSVLLSPAASFLPLPAFRGGGDFRPDHLKTMHLSSESRKRKIR